MWGSLEIRQIKNPQTFAGAMQMWQNAKPWRSETGEYDPRPICWEYRRKKHMSIRKGLDGSIIFTLFRIDVVTYHPDESVTIEGYSSQSTNIFARKLLPKGLSVDFNKYFSIVWIEKRELEPGDDYRRQSGFNRGKIAVRLIPAKDGEFLWNFAPETPSKPFEVKYLKSNARAALKARGYFDFRLFAKARMALSQDFSEVERVLGKSPQYLACLAKRSEWSKLLGSGFGPRSSFYSRQLISCRLEGLLERIRYEIYRTDNYIEVVKIPYVKDWQQMSNIIKQSNK
jgi:hypothetical protein